MRQKILKGLLIIYGVFVAVDMFERITRNNQSIGAAFIQSAMLPVHVAGTLFQLALNPSAWGDALNVSAVTIKSVFSSADPAQTVSDGYDAVVALARGGKQANNTIMLPQPAVNNPEIVSQADNIPTDPRYIAQ